MNILIEGPDGTGKTTLAKKLASIFNMTYIHITRSNTSGNNISFNNFLRMNDVDNCICDRGYVSNIVYSTVFNDTPKLSPIQANQQRALFDIKILCIIRDKQKYIQSFNDLKQQREELYNDMSEVYDQYIDLIDEFDFVYDFTTQSSGAVVVFCDKILR